MRVSDPVRVVRPVAAMLALVLVSGCVQHKPADCVGGLACGDGGSGESHTGTPAYDPYDPVQAARLHKREEGGGGSGY